VSIDSDDEFNLKQKPKKEIKKDNFRPPNVWNFPIDKIPDLDKKNIQIRLVDPRNHYLDPRIPTFLSKLKDIKNKMLDYSKVNKHDLWKYFIDRAVDVFQLIRFLI